MWLFAPQGHPHHLSIQAAMSGFVWQSSLPRGSRKGLTEAQAIVGWVSAYV